jgi:hypothetical protein
MTPSLLNHAERLVAISTAHLRPATRKRLADDRLSVLAYPNEYGGFAYVGDDDGLTPVEPELAVLIKAARREGIVWIKFDADALQVEGFETFGDEELEDGGHGVVGDCSTNAAQCSEAVATPPLESEGNTKEVWTCPRCRSFDVNQDANYHLNTGEYFTYDNMSCADCGYDGHSFNSHVVPVSFDIETDQLPERGS